MCPLRSNSWGEAMSKAISAAITAVFAVLIIASLMLLPFTAALAAVLVLCVLFVLIDAMRNRILFKMAVRNVVRRPGTTALVLAGLMVGTAIISATLVVGDTFDNMVVGEVTQGYGEIDFGVTGQGQSLDGYFDLSNVTSVREAVLEIDHVATAGVVHQHIVYHIESGQQSVPSLRIGVRDHSRRRFRPGRIRTAQRRGRQRPAVGQHGIRQCGPGQRHRHLRRRCHSPLPCG